MISDHTDKMWRHFPSNAHPVRSNLVHDVVSFWHWRGANSKCALQCMESCRILHNKLMLLACRLKIIPTSNLKLMMSFLVSHHQYYFQLLKLLILVALTRHAALNLACLLEVGQQAQYTISKFFQTRTTIKLKNDPQVLGTGTAFLSSQGRYQLHETPLGTSRARNAVDFFSYELLNARNKKKSYQRATYENKISTFCQRSAPFCFQETHRLNAIFTTRSTYDEPCKICPQQTEATQMQAHQAT